jgi:hypothetical protein
VNVRPAVFALAALALIVLVTPTACRKQEQAVVGVAQNAVNAEKQAQAAAAATATERESQRAALAAVPLPTKSLYVDVHDAAAWANPFLAVDAQTVTLRVVNADANPSTAGQGTLLRPEAARRQELQLHPNDVVKALIALPRGAWHYGRVVAVAESPAANPKDRAQVRRNLEELIQQLNDLGIVVDEWPTK